MEDSYNDMHTADSAPQNPTEGHGDSNVDALTMLQEMQQKMDESVLKLKTDFDTMDKANAEYDQARVEHNQMLADATKKANERIQKVREEEDNRIAALRGELSQELKKAGDVADEATIMYKETYDAILDEGVLSRAQLASLGYSKKTARRVASR